MHPLSTIQWNPSQTLLLIKTDAFYDFIHSFIHSGEMVAETKNGDWGHIKWSIHCLPSWLSSSRCPLVVLLLLLLLLLALGKAQTFLSILFWDYQQSPSSHTTIHRHNSPPSQTWFSCLGNHFSFSHLTNHVFFFLKVLV